MIPKHIFCIPYIFLYTFWLLFVNNFIIFRYFNYTNVFATVAIP